MATRVRPSRSRRSDPQADDALVRRWLAPYALNTQRNYRLDLQHFRDAIGKPLISIRQGDIDAVLVGLDMPPAVYRRRVAALRSFFAFAREVGALRRRLIIDVSTPAPERKLPVVSEDHVAQMLDMTATEREYCVIALAYYGALSASEQAALRWSDIHIRRNEITVAVHGDRARTVTLSSFLAAPLQRLRGRRGDTEPVLPSRLGGQLHQHSIRHIVRTVAAESGLPTITIQRLRNSHARHALAHGADLQSVSTTLGHRTIRTTARHLGAGRSGLALPVPRRRRSQT